MMGVVGAHHPFERGKNLIEELVGIELNTKSVERVSESIGEEILKMERQWLQGGSQW